MKTVIVAEKKSVAEDLVRALLSGRPETHDGFFSSGDTAVTYCSGHLVGLAEPDEYPGKNWSSWRFDTLPVVPDGLDFRYKPVNERAAKQLGVIKQLTRNADLVVNACEPAGKESSSFGTPCAGAAGERDENQGSQVISRLNGCGTTR